MFKKLLIVFVVAALLIPATAFAKGRPDFAASKSESQNFRAENQDKVAAEADLEVVALDQNGQGDDANTGKGNEISKYNKFIRDERKALSTKQKELKRELKEKIKVERAELKAKHKALKNEEKAKRKAQRDALKEARKAQILNRVRIHSDESSRTINRILRERFTSRIDSDTVNGKPCREDSVAIENQPSDDDSPSIENGPSSEDSPTAMHRGKGIANAMSKILRNMKRKTGNAVFALKIVVIKFTSWLHLDV